MLTNESKLETNLMLTYYTSFRGERIKGQFGNCPKKTFISRRMMLNRQVTTTVTAVLACAIIIKASSKACSCLLQV